MSRQKTPALLPLQYFSDNGQCKFPVLIVLADCLWLEYRRTNDVIKWFDRST